MTAASTQTGMGLVIARTEWVTRRFGSGRTEVRALRGVTLSVSRGELVALRGRSGSGKSTLLSIIGGLDQPTSGRVEVAGHDGCCAPSCTPRASPRSSPLTAPS